MQRFRKYQGRRDAEVARRLTAALASAPPRPQLNAHYAAAVRRLLRKRAGAGLVAMRALPCAGRHANDFLEDAREVALLGEPRFESDVCL